MPVAWAVIDLVSSLVQRAAPCSGTLLKSWTPREQPIGCSGHLCNYAFVSQVLTRLLHARQERCSPQRLTLQRAHQTLFLYLQVNAPLVVLNLSQQTDSSDLLGGFRPVEAHSAAAPLLPAFCQLVAATWPRFANIQSPSLCKVVPVSIREEPCSLVTI